MTKCICRWHNPRGWPGDKNQLPTYPRSRLKQIQRESVWQREYRATALVSYAATTTRGGEGGCRRRRVNSSSRRNSSRKIKQHVSTPLNDAIIVCAESLLRKRVCERGSVPTTCYWSVDCFVYPTAPPPPPHTTSPPPPPLPAAADWN